ncbi:MAG TPA: nucleoside hydrolase [Actinomycetota bacterium]|nr:nucleoside hydrolase [Actinomycetota bacterium]
MPTPVLIDTDPGIDDAIALLLALRSPELEIAGITVVHGNVPVEAGTLNAFKVLELAGRRDIPVARGAARPLLRQPVTAEIVHGADGLADLMPAPERIDLHPEYGPTFLARRLEEVDRPVTVVTLGPLTNLAVALLAAPGAAAGVERVVAMGGAVRVEGNVTPSAEFNVYADPEAAAIVLASGIPVTLVPLDATMHATVPGAVGRKLQGSDDPVERFLGDLIAHAAGVYRRYYGTEDVAMHDPLALAVAIDPSLVETRRVHVAVETGGSITAGRTVADFWGIPEPWGEPNADVALGVDAGRFDELLWRRLIGRYPP